MQIGKKLIAMTLAEILVALTIIGVVAALTVPTLKKHTQREETIVKLKKGLMTLEQSVDSAILEHGEPDKWSKMSTGLFKEYIVPQLNVAKDCTDSSVDECFPSDVKSITNKPNKAVVTVDGISVGNNGHYFFIDTNNLAEPNILGVDVFKFEFEKELEEGTGTARYTKTRNYDVRGDWKFRPKDDAKNIIERGWKITEW